MKYITFHQNPDFKIAILAYDLDYGGMKKNYIDEGLIPAGADADIDKEIIAYQLEYTTSGSKNKRKALPVADRREFLTELLTILKDIGVQHIICAQPDYFKTLTGQAKAALEVGSLHSPDSNHFGEFADMEVAYIPNFKMAFFDPVKTAHGISLACEAIINDRSGFYTDPGKDIIRSCYYPQTLSEVSEVLEQISNIPMLSADIEAFSLEHHDAGIASIAFAWGENDGVAFQVDWRPGFKNHEIRRCLARFFILRHMLYPESKIIWHNAAYDLTVLIYQLKDAVPEKIDHDVVDETFDSLIDPACVEDTQIITYLATNSCAGNKLSLKDQAVEFAGNYAVEDIKDVTKIPVRQLLEYNLVDALSTWFVYNKNYPLIVEQDQEGIYREIFLPSLVDVIDMQLNGLPVDMDQVAKSKKALEDIRDTAVRTITNNQIVVEYTHYLKEEEVKKRNAKLKKKRITTDDVTLEFNPGSDRQLAGLLFTREFVGLPVLKKTDSGAPSTKGEVLKSVKAHTKDPDILALLDAVIEYKDVAILLSTFIPALENARKALDGNYYMHGNFKLGGTVSGRLSSMDPNLQNLPSKSRLAKYIKQCIKAAAGWVLVGLDFDSLEDKISALITKDPNKLKVYTDGYDGHCLRAFSYFGDQMPNIDGSSVDSINSIAVDYPELRQDSKAPTFLLTYAGTYHGLMNNCGFDATTALQIEEKYHELYKVSDDWVALQIEGARKDGYITCAFGLRVRTPVLKQTVETERHTPYAAKAEARTAGNALGQSWGLLNNRAASEFMQMVRANPEWRDSIKICCQIHDAQYYLVRDDVNVLSWFNKELSRCVKWQKHPAITHPDVKLSGEVSIFYPTWAEEHSIPNDATAEDITNKAQEILANT